MVGLRESIYVPFLLFLTRPIFAQNVIKPVTGPNSLLRYEADVSQHTIASKVGGLDVSSLASKLSNIPTLDVQFFSDEGHMNFTRKNSTDDDWFGEDDDGDSMNLIVDESGKFYGSVNFEGHVYNIRTLPDGYTQVERIDEFPPEDVPHHDPLLGRRQRRQRKLRGSQQHERRELDSQDDGSVIDVMCIYTKNAMCAEAGYGNTKFCPNSATNRAPMNAKCQLAIAETNHAYDNSGIDTQMRLVHTGVVSHEDMSANGFRNLLRKLTKPNDGVMDEVHGWRDQYRADLVALITENSKYCGLGWKFSNNDAKGFSVSSRACVTGYYTFGHETGHNMGCKHDRTTNGHTSTASYPNSNYGYRDPRGRYRTIMAYRCPGGCPKVQRFSNDEFTVSFQGRQVVAGDAYNDCAKQINLVRKKVARFRQSLDDSSGGGGGGLPNPAPTGSGPTICGNGQVEFKLDLTTDRFGRETTWKLTTQRNNRIDVVAQNSRQYGEFEKDLHTQCINRDECYSFTIEDSWGDGMCCTHGQGQYVVFLDGNEVRRGGDFQKEDTFKVNCNAGGGGNTKCGAGKVEFKLNLKTDMYGHETYWKLQKGNNNDQVVVSSRPYGQNDEDVVEQCLDEDECYTFVIEDSWGDGICCTFGDGGYTVSYGGMRVKNGSSFGREEKVYLNCEN